MLSREPAGETNLLAFVPPTMPTQEGSASPTLQQHALPLIVEDLCVVSPVVPRATSPPLSLSLIETAPVIISCPTRREPASALSGGVAGTRAKKTPDRLVFQSEDLVDKFLHSSIAGDDEDFVNAFLVTFRRFVSSRQVLEQLAGRFRFVSAQTSETTLRRYGQLRLCSTLSTWLQSYPGDFSDPTTLDCLRHFVETDLKCGGPWLSHHLHELTPLLPSLLRITDPDVGWSVSGNDIARREPSDQARPQSRVILPMNRSQVSLASTFSSDAPSLTEDSVASSADNGRNQHCDEVSLDSRDSTTGSASSPMKRELSAVTAAIVETSNGLAEVSAQGIAVQITRLAWDRFAGITVCPRCQSNVLGTSR